MQNSIVLYLQQQATRFAQDCTSRKMQLPRAQTMREVRRLCDVHAKAEVRFLPDVRQAESTLTHAAERKMEELLKKQLDAMAVTQDIEVLKKMRGQYMQNEWCFLRGTFARLYVQAEQQSMKMLGVLQQAGLHNAADNPGDDAPSP